MRSLTNLLLVLLASTAWSNDGIEITETAKVAALIDVQDKIESIGAAVGGCTGLGKKHGDCLCEHEELILEFNRTVEELFETYPDLESVDLVSFETSTGLMISQSLSGIRNQARMSLDRD